MTRPPPGSQARRRARVAGFSSGPLPCPGASALPARVALRWQAWPHGTCLLALVACRAKSAWHFLYAYALLCRSRHRDGDRLIARLAEAWGAEPRFPDRMIAFIRHNQ